MIRLSRARPPPSSFSTICNSKHSSTANTSPSTARTSSISDDGVRRDLHALLLSPSSFDSTPRPQILSRISPFQCEALLSQLLPSLPVNAALRFFSFAADKCGFRFTVRSYCLLVHSLLDSGLISPARLFLTRLLDPSSSLPVIYAVQDRRIHELVDAITDPASARPETIQTAVDVLVHVCATQFSHAPRLAVDAFQLLVSRGICPTLRMCNILISFMVRGMRGGDARMVFDRMRGFVSPDVYSYTPLIDVLCKTGNVEDAIRLFREMESTGISPTVVTYNTLLNGLCKKNMLKEAMDFKKEMEKSCVEPTVVTYCAIINGFFGENRFEDVGCLFREMIERGIAPNEFVYNAMVGVHSRMGCFAEALMLKDEMMSKGIRPNRITYTMIIRSLCNAGEFEQAECVFDEMLKNKVSFVRG